MSRTHFEQLAPSTLRPFRLNSAVFGETDADLTPEFIASVKDRGVITPCLVTAKGMILSGHRRISAAIKAGKQLVPCMVTDESDPDALQVLWADCNRNREMTHEQRTRYYQTLLDIEVKNRKPSGPPAQGSAPKSAGDSDSRPDQPIRKDSRDIAAEKAGISSRYKAEVMSDVVDAIDELTASGDTEKAAEVRQALETKPASVARRTAKAATKPEADDESTPPVEDDRTWKKPDVKKFRDAYTAMVRVIDRGVELEQLTTPEHRKFIDLFRQFGNDWQKLFPQQEWL